MMQTTEVKCPHCGDVTKEPLRRTVSPFKSSYEKAETAKGDRPEPDADPLTLTWVGVHPESMAKCDKCGKEFLYQLRTIVVCDTAIHPFKQ